MFGNVKVDYKPCKTVTQLKRACDYILGRLHSQIRNGVVKTEDHLYDAFDCDRDHFAQEVLLTRQAFRKPIDGKKNLAYKISISFHPEDNERLTHEQAYDIAKDFAAKFFFSKGYDVLLAVHTDTAHIHAHFIIGNCNRNTGKAFRRHEAELHEMSEYFGKECASLGLQHSVRESFYSERRDRMRKAFGESQMERKGAESFKSELREVIEIECADPRNNTLDDVVRALREHYNVECRVSGNTISYRHPQYKNKSGQPVSVRGKKLGDRYTVKGIQYELTEKRKFESECLAGRNGTSRSNECRKGTGGTQGQGSDIAAFDRTENGIDAAKLYAEYAARVRQAEPESTECSERTGAIHTIRPFRHR